MRATGRFAALASLLAAVFLVAACGGGGSKSGEAEKLTAVPSAAAIDTGQVSDDQLRTMVLPLEAYGGKYAGYELDDASGFRNNDYEINDATDADKEKAAIEKYGRVNGYEQTFSSLEAFTTFQGVMMVASDVTLFENADGASSYLQSGPDRMREEAESGSSGVTLQDLSTFDAGKIGEEAMGATASASFPAGGAALRMTTVAVRRGRVVASVALMGTADIEVQDEAIALARVLDERVVGVLRGEVEIEPTPEPKPAARATAEAQAEDAPAAGDGATPVTALSSFRYSSRIEIAVGEGHMEIATSGDFQAPERLTCTTEISLAGARLGVDRLTVIGNSAWRDQGNGWQPETGDLSSDLDLCPGSAEFWRDFDLGQEVSGLPGTADSINGVAARRFSLGDMAQGLGMLGLTPSSLKGLTINRFEVWLAQDGGWLVSMDMDMAADAEALSGVFGLGNAATGAQGNVTMKLDITDANDPGIQVTAPD